MLTQQLKDTKKMEKNYSELKMQAEMTAAAWKANTLNNQQKMNDEEYIAKLDIVFDRPNEISGRVYKKKQIEFQLNNFINSKSEYDLFIDCKSDTIEIDLASVCGKIVSFQMIDNGTILAKYTIFDKTPYGKIFADLNVEKIPLILTTVMTGDLQKDMSVVDLKIHKFSFSL